MTAMIALKPTGTPVFGSGVRSCGPAMIRPTGSATKNATIPTIARTHP